MRQAVKEFRDFLMQGNLIELAVAFVIGAAFAALAKALITDLISPIIGIPGKLSLASSTFKIHGSTFAYGDFINEVIVFVSTAAAVFFFIVKPVDIIRKHRSNVTIEDAPDFKDCSECLSSIPVAAKRCKYCTSPQD